MTNNVVENVVYVELKTNGAFKLISEENACFDASFQQSVIIYSL